MKRLLLLIILAVSAADAVFKYLAVRSLPPADQSHLFFLIDLALHKNPGIAFDIPLPFVVILPLTALICGIFCYFIKKTWHSEPKIAVASFMIVAGALGNLFDRWLNGFTTDYIILFRTSAINLSDLLIVVGMLTFLWYHKGNPSERQTS